MTWFVSESRLVAVIEDGHLAGERISLERDRTVLAASMPLDQWTTAVIATQRSLLGRRPARLRLHDPSGALDLEPMVRVLGRGNGERAKDPTAFASRLIDLALRAKVQAGLATDVDCATLLASGWQPIEDGDTEFTVDIRTYHEEAVDDGRPIAVQPGSILDTAVTGQRLLVEVDDVSGPPAVPAAGWYPDPVGHAALRWWDGDDWTDHVND